ncbi:hypothetical protein G5V59_19925 [Nocardioides sp. W3-2-3]|uniref:hypothetical protein n=1 Tax=Nocardioides convexus TaxID=2712224 RepID=UPI0024186822|nr:hypothetical protein [Nocardioides convexus]NHA01335.1 hypothetical protein [Nocardioides convexus]
MPRIPQIRFSPVALALVVVALLLGSTSGAVAGALITGKQIKNESVTGADIRNGSLGSVDIQNNGLLGADVRDGSLTHVDIADEPAAWGAATKVQTDNFTAGTWTPVVSKALVTGRAGYLTITGTLYAEDDFSLAGTGRLAYDLRIDGKVVDARKPPDLRRPGCGGERRRHDRRTGGGGWTHRPGSSSRSRAPARTSTAARLSAVYTPTGSSSGLALVAGRTVHPRTANR